MTNPNNCSTCKYKETVGPDDEPGQHCYMFRDAPTEVCMQHTGRQTPHWSKAAYIDPFDLPIHNPGLDISALKEVQGDV